MNITASVAKLLPAIPLGLLLTISVALGLPNNNLKTAVIKELQHFGACDASAAIAIDSQSSIVANDEDNILRIYDRENSGKPKQVIDINGFFANNPREKEVDLEGATAINDRIYWISSHGRNRKGEQTIERHNFLATRVVSTETEIEVQQAGRAYTNLVSALLQEETFKPYGLAAAETLAPKAEGGLNIEGLAAAPNQDLWIGFRSPIPGGKALLIPLKNSAELVQELDAAPSFGAAILLDLGGRGIRSIEYWPDRKIYLIVAGTADIGANSRIYQWSGQATETPRWLSDLKLPAEFNPEAIVFYPGQQQQFQLLSDDGSIRRNAIACKDLPSSSPHKYFRSLWVDTARSL